RRAAGSWRDQSTGMGLSLRRLRSLALRCGTGFAACSSSCIQQARLGLPHLSKVGTAFDENHLTEESATLAGAIRAPLGERSPRNTKTALEGRPGVPAKPGNIKGCGNPDTPRKSESLQEPFLAAAELCLKSCAPFGGTLSPNGEAMLAEQFHAAAAAAKTTA